MKLSDSILLGSTVVKSTPGVLISDGGEIGCALGMAALAVGAQWKRSTPEEAARDSRTGGMENVWPWLAHSVTYPCTCFAHRSSGSDRAKTVIAHLFDSHVFGAKDWTLDQLIEFCRSIEPIGNTPVQQSQDMVTAGRDPEPGEPRGMNL